ncbi:amidase signature enzyme [Flagelloscypha sp. PMI_526]|nr:amidase signature enzyme [Flagelloscypha sp. PMI_526]
MISIPFVTHWLNCRKKRQQQQQAIDALDPVYKEPITKWEAGILDQKIEHIVEGVQTGVFSAAQVLAAFGKKALLAHKHTNCLTEIMISDAQLLATAEKPPQGPLAGLPVSLKDMCGVHGYDSTIGYSSFVGKPSPANAAIVRLLLDAGALPFVKTTIPTTLLAFESSSSLFGQTTNPHNPKYTCGGSSSGEAALLAYGGSRIGIGTDVAGSVRVPAHYSGIYSMKCSTGRFPRMGGVTSTPGQEGVLSTYSPMARTLSDLEYFWKAIVSMEPWTYDHSCLVKPWIDYKLGKVLKFGILSDDGVVAPSPACRRALDIVVNALKANDHNITTISPPSPADGLVLGSQLLLVDAAKAATTPLSWGESNDPGIAQLGRFLSFPSFVRRIYTWYIRYIRRDVIYARLLEGAGEKTVPEFWNLFVKREAYRAEWFDWWNAQKDDAGDLDFVLTVPNALPAMPHGGGKQGWMGCGYTFLWNVLDYTAGVIPVTHVSSDLDILKQPFQPRNAIERGMYSMYDAREMNKLPVGVQIIGRRLEEEKVMAGMKLIELYLQAEGKGYEVLKT